jgi:hypothetical protein
MSNRAVSRGGESGGSGIGSPDPLLARLVAAWPTLDAAKRAKVAALLDSAG